MTEDKMTGWHHGLNGHGFEQVLGDGEGQGSLACCSPWGRKELDMTQRLNHNNVDTKQEGKNGLINSKKNKVVQESKFHSSIWQQ